MILANHKRKENFRNIDGFTEIAQKKILKLDKKKNIVIRDHEKIKKIYN